MIRNPIIDNTKLFMSVLVVFGHLIEPLIHENGFIKTIYTFIYSFHMPVFILIAGAFTQTDLSRHRILKNINSLLVPLLIFTILYELFNLLTTQSVSSYTSNGQPYWILWFLWSVFLWKTILPFFMKLPAPLLIAIAISLLAGYIDEIGYFLGIARTLYFFPFFILGHQVGASMLSNPSLTAIPKTVYLGLLVGFFMLCWLFNGFPYQWFYGSYSYARLGEGSPYIALFKVGIYLLSLGTSLAILMLMPNKKPRLAKRGQNSFFVYVWHGFLIKIFVGVGFIQWINKAPTIITISSLFALALLITYLLSSTFIANKTNCILLNPMRTVRSKNKDSE